MVVFLFFCCGCERVNDDAEVPFVAVVEDDNDVVVEEEDDDEDGFSSELLL